MRKRYAAVVLAAGISSRMGEFKPLLPLGEETIADHVVSTFRQNGVDVYLVVGHQGNKLRDGIKSQDITVVENSNYRQGMFTSVQAGIRHLPTDCPAFFIMPVDIPLVKPATVSRLIKESEANPDKIIIPSFGKKRGHPPLIPTKLAPAILEWSEDGGLKSFLREYEGNTIEVPVADSNILHDTDTRDDYDALLDRFRRYGVPTDGECGVILNDICRVSTAIQRHGKKVAEVAVAIGRALVSSGCEVDLEAVRMAARLHDIAKGQPKHDAAGGRILNDLGFKTVGEIVSIHSWLGENETEVSIESKVVYLADKFVKGEDIVSLEVRYNSADNKYGSTPEMKAVIRGRWLQALRIKQEIENILGCSLEVAIS